MQPHQHGQVTPISAAIKDSQKILKADHLVVCGKEIPAHLTDLPPFPGIEFGRRHHDDRGSHLMMAQAAQLGARHFVCSGNIGDESARGSACRVRDPA